MMIGELPAKVSRLYTAKDTVVRTNIRLMNWLFICSGTIMTGLLTVEGPIPYFLIGILCSSLILYKLSNSNNFIYKVLTEINKKQAIFAGITSLIAGYVLITSFNSNNKEIGKILLKIFNWIHVPATHHDMIRNMVAAVTGVIAIFAVFTFFCWAYKEFVHVCTNFILSLNKVEKRYLISFGIVMAVATIVVFSFTNVFYGPKTNEQVINKGVVYTPTTSGVIYYDVVYSADTGSQVETDVFSNVSGSDNDLKQPLFGLVALPFGLFARLISKLLFFIPYGYIYPVILNITQVLILQITIILISRMLKLQSISQLLFLILFNATYSFLLFSLNIEQYIFSLFWLILFVNAYLSGRLDRYKEYYFIGAVGAMVTSVIMFPLLLRTMSLKNWVNDLTKILIKFLAILTVIGQLPLVFDSVRYVEGLWQFTGEHLNFHEKLLQFVNFIAACFVTPNAGLDTTTYQQISYQLFPVTSLNIFGVSVIVLAILGFVLTYKETFSRICLGWIVFSFIILCIIGWGTMENGLILYAIYFSWAYLSLIYKVIEKLFSRLTYIKYTLLASAILTCLLVNIPGIYNLIQFGIDYYPVSK